MKNFQRLGARILKALHAKAPKSVSVDELCDDGLEGFTSEELDKHLQALMHLGLVDRVSFCGSVRWLITADGVEAIADVVDPDPEAPEPSATAFLCFSEDELDNWWTGLDVEAKADAFAGFSLRAQGQDESFVHIPEPRIPITGVVGGSRAVTQPDGAGDEAVQS